MKKYLLILFSLALMFTLVVGCSELTDKVNNPATTEDPILAEAEAFNQALLDGKYRFSVDENGDLIPFDGLNIPVGEEDLYQAFVQLSEIPKGKGQPEQGVTLSKLSNGWRYACWREICYALSRTKYLQGQRGQSRRSYRWNNAWWLAGDWDYDGLGYGRGGQCKHFASRIVTRATGGAYSLPSGYNYAKGNIGWCRPGDIIQRSGSNKHTAIVFAVLARDGNGRATRIDVIDANFVNYPHEMIARHYLPYGSWSLSYFKVW